MYFWTGNFFKIQKISSLNRICCHWQWNSSLFTPFPFLEKQGGYSKLWFTKAKLLLAFKLVIRFLSPWKFDTNWRLYWWNICNLFYLFIGCSFCKNHNLVKVSQKILGVLNWHDVQYSFLISKYHIPLSLNYLKLYIAGKQIS